MLNKWLLIIFFLLLITSIVEMIVYVSTANKLSVLPGGVPTPTDIAIPSAIRSNVLKKTTTYNEWMTKRNDVVTVSTNTQIATGTVLETGKEASSSGFQVTLQNTKGKYTYHFTDTELALIKVASSSGTKKNYRLEDIKPGEKVTVTEKYDLMTPDSKYIGIDLLIQ